MTDTTQTTEPTVHNDENPIFAPDFAREYGLTVVGNCVLGNATYYARIAAGAITRKVQERNLMAWQRQAAIAEWRLNRKPAKRRGVRA